ncbi:MAG TPA: IS6 family transposase, partial [Polyangiales bacterium]
PAHADQHHLQRVVHPLDHLAQRLDHQHHPVVRLGSAYQHRLIATEPEGARLDKGSRVNREIYARFCERLRVKAPWSTHPYVKIHGAWTYLYRAVDREGQTVDFRLSPNRDVAAAKAFFRKALSTQGRAPVSITLDGYAASHRAVRELPLESARWKRVKLRSSKYLNNMIEQDHRGVKSRTGPMLGFKVFDNAAITIAGVELQHRNRKDQFAFGRLRAQGRTTPEIWNAVLSA